MTIVHLGPNYFSCESTDTKPTNLPVNFVSYETDTDTGFIWDGASWVKITGRFDNYIDIKKISIPSNPATGYSRIYTKQIDSNNDGLFALIKKASGFVEVQII